MTTSPLDSLREFALAAIAADRFPRDEHRLRSLACATCNVTPQEVSVEHHSGDRPGDFHGVVHGRCTTCGEESTLFSITGQHSQLLRQEEIRCRCGQNGWWLVICDRIEGEDGLPGFFDEGVVVGRCASCGYQHVVVAYD